MPYRLLRLMAVLIAMYAAVHASADRRVEKWNRALTSIDQALKEGRYQEARSETLRVTRWMLEGIGGGPDAMYTLAVASSFRALAEAGLGNAHEAEWYWHTAAGLYPPFADVDLGVYGRAGEVVRRIYRDVETAAHETAGAASSLVPPEVIHRMKVKYPRGALESGIAQPIQVEVLVGTDGVPRRPRIIDTGWEPSLAFATFEALKGWRFSPAKADGVPVPSWFVVTMSFEIRY